MLKSLLGEVLQKIRSWLYLWKAGWVGQQCDGHTAVAPSMISGEIGMMGPGSPAVPKWVLQIQPVSVQHQAFICKWIINADGLEAWGSAFPR